MEGSGLDLVVSQAIVQNNMPDAKELENFLTATATESVSVKQGICYALFAYDAAFAIHLDEAERSISSATQRGGIKRQHPAPAYFEYRPAPVRISQAANPVLLGSYRSCAEVDVVLYDFGAVSVMYSIPLAGSLFGLCTLSEELYNNERLLADSRQHV